MEKQYQIYIDSQLGVREGRLRLRRKSEAEENVQGVLSLLGFENKVEGRLSGSQLILGHKLRTMLGEMYCISELTLEGKKLEGQASVRIPQNFRKDSMIKMKLWGHLLPGESSEREHEKEFERGGNREEREEGQEGGINEI